MRLAQRRFSYSDQERFASVSGDRNPMHLDALQARRTQAGAPVVHGINLLLWALDSLASAHPELPPLRSCRTQFNKFIYLNESAEVEVTQQGFTSARLNITVDRASRCKVTVNFGEPSRDFPAWPASLEPISYSLEALNLDFEEMAGRSGSLPFQMTPEDAAGLYPAAAMWLGTRRIAALAASTHLVGMICPGLHSIYSELSISTYAETVPKNFLAFRVTETDSRFRSVEQEIAGGGLTGTVKSFARMPPVRQASMESLAGLIPSSEFAGSVALIVGGSRGLGELTAKLIATGGGRAIITWHTGKDDAERVAQEIRAAGGRCETLAYDARRPAAQQLALLPETPTYAYYFATPAIFRPQAETFNAERLQEFLAVYVDGFWQLSQALRARQPKISLFYPSSVAVTERPKGMTEYAMAKTAGEVLCADMNASLAPLHITASRLPRVLTDQTATLVATEAALPIDTMLPIICEVQSWPR